MLFNRFFFDNLRIKKWVIFLFFFFNFSFFFIYLYLSYSFYDLLVSGSVLDLCLLDDCNFFDTYIVLDAFQNDNNDLNIVRPVYRYSLSNDVFYQDPCMRKFRNYFRIHWNKHGLSDDHLLQEQLKRRFYVRSPRCGVCNAMLHCCYIMDNFVEVLNSDYQLNDHEREIIFMSFIVKVLVPSDYQFISVEELWNDFIDFLPEHRKSEFYQFTEDFIRKAKKCEGNYKNYFIKYAYGRIDRYVRVY